MELLLSIIIPIFQFLFQSYPRLFNRYFGVDVWKRMIEVDLVRKNNHRIPLGIVKDGSMIEGYFDNPPLFPYLLSFLSKKALLNYQGFIAPIFDCLQNILVFFITLGLTSRFEIALFAQLIYASIPLINLENSYLTPRSMGYFNFTLAFYPLLVYSATGNFIYLAASFIFVVLLFFTHRFALQSFLFIILAFTFIDKTPVYLLIFLGAFLSALIISKGYYLRVLEGHLFIIYFWVKNGKYRFAHQVRGLEEQKRKMDFVNLIYFLLSKFAPLSLFATNLWLIIPFLVLLAPIFSISEFYFMQNELFIKMSIWAVFFYIFSSLVLSIKMLMPIGEGQRYLEMATVPSSILSSVLFFNLIDGKYKNFAILIYTFIFIFNISLILYSQWVGILKDKNRSLTKGMESVFKYINGFKPAPKILCIPHQLCGLLLFNTKAKILSDTQLKGALKISDVYPVLKDSVDNIAKKYSLDLLVLKKTYATAEELKLKKSQLLFETEDTQIFKIGG